MKTEKEKNWDNLENDAEVTLIYRDLKEILKNREKAGKTEAIREEIDFLLGLADITSHISVDRLIAERVILLKSKIGALAKKQSSGETK